eukprot:TRINITY_DN5750_c0_g1_i1.p1 TRINITY_DN5750_c0_g1~~TRINITY_DN5750_c0_g1_i1.p1  ORF type:complete len:865 (-),score=191.08 TRINITY_DN5750_c0_g1_i1:952-3546(-)
MYEDDLDISVENLEDEFDDFGGEVNEFLRFAYLRKDNSANVKHYERCSLKIADWVGNEAKKHVKGSSSEFKLKEEEANLRDEKNTWNLVRAVSETRPDPSTVAPDVTIINVNIDRPTLAEKLSNEDPTIQRLITIKKWLENTYEKKKEISKSYNHVLKEIHDDVNKIYPDASYEEQSFRFSTMSPPPSSTKYKGGQDRSANNINSSYELWEILRKGELEDHLFDDTHVDKNIFMKTHEYWRQSNLYGSKMNNCFRNLYKTFAREIFNRSNAGNENNLNLNFFETAVLAIQSDDLSAIEKLGLKTWEDNLWANISIIIELMLDKRISEFKEEFVEDSQQPLSSKIPYIRTLPDVITALKDSNDVDIKKAAHSPYRLIQSSLMFQTPIDTIALISSWLDPKSNVGFSVTPSLLRFAVHLYIYYRDTNQFRRYDQETIPDDQQNRLNDAITRILHRYIDHLIKDRNYEIVAMFTADLLDENDKIMIYASFLASLGSDENLRITCLKLAEDNNLDIARITSQVVEIEQKNSVNAQEVKIRKRILSEDGQTVEVEEVYCELLPEDLKKIHSLEWLCYNQKQRGEVIIQANNLIRSFLYSASIKHFESQSNLGNHDDFTFPLSIRSQDIVSKKIEASKETFDLLSGLVPDLKDTVSNLINESYNDREKQMYSDYLQEYESYESFLRSIYYFTYWFTHFHQKPIRPQNLVEFPASRLPSNAEEIEQKFVWDQYNRALMSWNERHNELKKFAEDSLLLVIKNPKWLVDEEQYIQSSMDVDVDGDDMNMNGDPNRKMMMKLIRRLCIPEVIYNLCYMYTGTGDAVKCLNLAPEVADPSEEIFKNFSKFQLKRFLFLLRESAIVVKELQVKGIK